MPLHDGFEIHLDRVITSGLPRNRAEWCYKLTLPRTKHRKVCIDFDGNQGSAFTDPGRFDDRRATDSERMKWGGVTVVKKDPARGDTPDNKKTVICLEAKNEHQPFEGGEIEFCFIGPGDSAGAGEVSIETQSLVSIRDSNRKGWLDRSWGRTDGVEVPAFALLDEEEVDERPLPQEPTASTAPVTIAEDGDMVVPSLEEVATIDLGEALTEEQVPLPSRITMLPIASIDGLSEEQASVLVEALEVESVGGLLRHPGIQSVGTLLRTVGG